MLGIDRLASLAVVGGRCRGRPAEAAPRAVDRRYALDEVAEITTYVGTGRKIGTVVPTLNGGGAR